MVPDFLSRPFKGKSDEALEDDTTPTDGSGQSVGHLHTLAYPHRAHREDRRVDEAGRVRVMLLPRMGSKIGVVPPSTEGSTVYTLLTGSSKDQQEQTLAQSLWESVLTTPATLTRVAQSHSSGFWEGWVCDEGCFGHLLTWVESQDLPMDRAQWIRTSFETL